MRHVVFRVGTERYGLPLASVREVVVPGILSVVPRAPGAVRGIMNLRGRVVTVVDLGMLFGIARISAPAADGTVGGKVLLLDRGKRDLGLLVDDVDAITALENVSGAPGSSLPSIRGVARSQAGAVTVLDAEGLDQQIAALFNTETR